MISILFSLTFSFQLWIEKLAKEKEKEVLNNDFAFITITLRYSPTRSDS